MPTKKKSRDVKKLVSDFLSGLVANEEAEMKDRLKASELLAKNTGDNSGGDDTRLDIHIDYGDGGK